MVVLDNLCVRVTKACNLACSHCRAPTESRREHLDLETFLKFIVDLKYLGLRRISLSGGEPFLYYALPELVSRCRENGICIAITTNGTCHEELARFIRQFPDADDILIKVSVDGDKRLHDEIRGRGVYSKVIRSLQMLSRSCFRVGINTVIRDHYRFITSLMEDVREERIEQWAMITYEDRKRRQTAAEICRIVSNIGRAVAYLKSLGFCGKIKVWDFLSHPNGGILVDVDGNVMMPSSYSGDDVVICSIRDYDRETIVAAIEERITQDPVAFFVAGS